MDAILLKDVRELVRFRIAEREVLAINLFAGKICLQFRPCPSHEATHLNHRICGDRPDEAMLLERFVFRLCENPGSPGWVKHRAHFEPLLCTECFQLIPEIRELSVREHRLEICHSHPLSCPQQFKPLGGRLGEIECGHH